MVVAEGQPLRFGQPDTSMTLTPLGKTRLMVNPCPFDQAPLKVSVRGGVVLRRAYKSQEEFRDVYRRQPRESFEYTVEAK